MRFIEHNSSAIGSIIQISTLQIFNISYNMNEFLFLDRTPNWCE